MAIPYTNVQFGYEHIIYFLKTHAYESNTLIPPG